jgi:hypothetical protein
MSLPLSWSSEAKAVVWLSFAALALISLVFICAGWVRLLRYRLSRRESQGTSSGCLGGLCGALALLLIPLPGYAKWCWLPLLLDLNAVPALLYAAYYWTFVARENPFESNPKGAAVCPGCGGLSDKWAAYCADCGQSLAGAVLLPQVRPGPARVKRGGAGKRGGDGKRGGTGKLACGHCRLVSAQASRFCRGCGKPLDDARDAAGTR